MSDPTAPDHSAEPAPEAAPAPHPADSLGEALHGIVSMVEASPAFHAMGAAVAQARARIDAAVAALKGNG